MVSDKFVEVCETLDGELRDKGSTATCFLEDSSVTVESIREEETVGVINDLDEDRIGGELIHTIESFDEFEVFNTYVNIKSKSGIDIAVRPNGRVEVVEG